MGKFNQKERLQELIEALITAYDKQIVLLNKPLTTKTSAKKEGEQEDSDEIKMTDSQIKTYSQGIKEAAETAEYLFNTISLKQKELDQIESGEKPKDPEITEKKPQEVSTIPNPTNKHLQ